MKSLPGSAVMIMHGPELFDGGEAAWLMNLLSPERVIVAGVMARTAAEESGLRVEFIAWPPSRVIGTLRGIVYLVTRGKTAKTGESVREYCCVPSHEKRACAYRVHGKGGLLLG